MASKASTFHHQTSLFILTFLGDTKTNVHISNLSSLASLSLYNNEEFTKVSAALRTPVFLA
jgi:hypothetical protein